MERIVHIAKTHEDALRWDILQHVRMTPEERQATARVLKGRVFYPDAKDVREWHRSG